MKQNEKASPPSDSTARIDTLMRAAGRAHQAGNFDQLKSILTDVLKLDPRHAAATYNLGILHRDLGDIFQAEVHLRRAISLDPNMIDAFQGLADLLVDAKHLLPARSLYEEALLRAPNRLSLLHNLTKTCMMLKDVAEAERLSRRILSIDDRASDAWSTLAWALLYGNGQADEALAAADQAIRLSPDTKHAQVFKERALRSLGRVADADGEWAGLLARAAADVDKARGFNEAYYWLNRLEQCRAVMTACIEANPERGEGFKDLAGVLMADGEFELAQDLLDRAAALAPANKVIQMVLGLSAFRLGKYRQALELYDARWHRAGNDKPWDIPVPEWDGKPIDGRLIVYCEQGIGDYVMFGLLFAELRRYAKSITIEVNSRVASIFRRTFADMPVVDRNALPGNWDCSQYQAKVAMGELPRLLGVDMENLPNRKGYIIPEPSLALKLRERYRALFPGKRLVGISWRSGNRDSATVRSIDLTLWRPIFETPDCAFISLQYGDVRRDIEALRAETGHVVHHDPEINPLQYLDPFASQIVAMDLVISVDNSTVHFAGAAGKPCWVLLPVNSDWRWLIDRPTSIWYDSLQLWRQKPGEGWDKVVDRVADRLRTIGTEPLIDAQAELCLRCGEELLRREAMGPAEEYFRWLLETGRHKGEAFHGIGKAAQKAQHFEDAAAILGRAVELAPDRIDYKADWSVALFEAGHREMAERLVRELTRQGSDPAALMAMGHILAGKGLLDQATDYFARILRSKPEHIVARTILAGLQALQGDDELAQKNFGRLVQQAPDLPGPHTAVAEIDLRHGREEAAWPNFGWRFGSAPEELPRHLAMIAPDDRPKSWSGGKIRRRRLFLRAERSELEQLLFAPWLQDALADSRSVRAECTPAAIPLLASAFPKLQLTAAGSLKPANLIEERIQLYASLADLVAAYPKTLTGGWLPYDRAEAATRRAALQVRGASGRIVVLAWQPTAAGMGDLQPLAPLFEVPGLSWVALPMGRLAAPVEQFLSSASCPPMCDPAWMRGGLASVAALLGSVDLVVSSEDLAATLAGAIGKPVWRIAAAAAHWSWGDAADSSTWHPTARIHRSVSGIESVVPAIRAGLEQFAGA